MKTNYTKQTGTKTNITKGFGYYPQRLSVAEAITWFLLTAFALFLSGTAKSDIPMGIVNNSATNVSQTVTGSNSSYQYNAAVATQAVK